MKTTSAVAVLIFLPLVLFADDERTCTMRDAARPSPNITYVLCEQGLLLVTTDEGAKWTTQKIADTEGLQALAFLDAKRALVAGDGGLLVATEDGGQTWTPRKIDTKQNLSDMQFIGEQGWAVGFDGVILHTTDGGKTWSPQNSGVTQALEAVHFLDPQNGWAAGWSGTILHTADGGKKWDQVKTASAQWSLTSIYFKDPKTGFIAGFAGQLIRTTDGGATWDKVTTPYSGWLTSILFDAQNRGWITTDDGLLLSMDNGATWKMTGANPDGSTDTQLFLNKLLHTSGPVWALGPFGLAKQTGDGLTWKKIGNPLADSGNGTTLAK